VFEDENMDDYIDDLRSPIAQMMLTIIKDYNHNDSKLFRYLPYRISKTKLTTDEQLFLNLFKETPIDKIFTLKNSYYSS
jgi:hypothetical protein